MRNSGFSGSRRLAVMIVATFVLAATSSHAALAGKQGAGNLDGKFGSHGKVLTAITAPAAAQIPAAGGAETDVISLATQPTGKIIAMGFHNELGGNYYALARYVDGVLDASFGSAGRVVFSAGTGTPAGMAIQSNGKIIVAGSVDPSTSGCQADFLVQRLGVDGAPDTTFGTGGQTITDFGGCDAANAMALAADNSIVVTGFTSGGLDVAVARYDANGNPAGGFGAGGKATAPGLGSGQSVAIQVGGRVVVGANNNGDFGLVGFTSTGVLDASFGTGGSTSTYFGDNDSATLAAITLRSDGRIVAVGGNHDFDNGKFSVAVAGYSASGILDASFGSGGLVQTAISGLIGEDQAGGVAIDPDGNVVVAGWTCDANCDFVVVRYLANGALDGSFGRRGIVTTDFSAGSGDLAREVVVQTDGKIVAAGKSDALGDDAFALARYKA